MKIADVIQICKRTKHVEIFNEKAKTEKFPDGSEEIHYSGGQWIGNGRAAYFMNGVPRIESESEFFQQYDVPKKQQKSYMVTQRTYPDNVDFSSWTEENEATAAEPTQITIGTGEVVLRGISYGGKLLFVPEEYLKPFGKSPDEAVEYEVRYIKNNIADSIPYLYIREEMEPGAVILPWRCRDNISHRNAADELRKIWYEFSAEIQAYAERKEKNK